MKTKRACERAVRATISLPPDLMRKAIDKQRKGHFAAFSDFIQHLIRYCEFAKAPR